MALKLDVSMFVPPPGQSSMRPSEWKSLRLAWPPKSSWLSRVRILFVGAGALPKQMSGSQITEADDDDHQVVVFVERGVLGGLLSLPGHGVGDFVGNVMSAAHPRERGGIDAL